jgi:formylmethanofuran dehydrogenase subunit B
MRGHHNVTGACATSLWQTGYPYAVNFSRGYPRYSPGEFSAVDILARGECDAALIIASDPLANFPLEASRHLARIPTIVMDPKINLTSMVADVVMPTALAGIECEGTAYRMDAVPIRLRKVLPSKFPSDREVLRRIIDGVKK